MAKGIRTIWIDSDTVGVTGTKVYKDGLLIDTVAQGIQEYKDPNVVPDVEYEYVLQAVTANGESVGEVLGVNKAFYTIEETPVIELTPIMTNFRVNSATPTHVHFDTPLGPIEGLTIQGFVISDRTISAVDSTLNYFTVTEPFTYWEQAITIKQENGNGVVYDFTMESVYNYMDEPIAATDRYAAFGASGSGDSVGDPASLADAEQAVAGETWHIKAGDYGNTRFALRNSGTPTNPIKFIGYRDNPGDITENYITSYDDIKNNWSTEEMPTLTGASITTSTRGIELRGNNIIVKNFQATNFAKNVADDSGTHTNFVLENFNSQDSDAGGNYGYGIGFWGTASEYYTLRNCVLLNSTSSNLDIKGALSKFNLIENCQAYNDNTSDADDNITDYHITTVGDNNIVRKCHVENFNSTSTNNSTHGITLRCGGGSEITSHNLIELNTSININDGYCARNQGTEYNVFKDCYSGNNNTFTNTESDPDSGGLSIFGCGDYNIFERLLCEDIAQGIIMRGDGTESAGVGTGNNNTVRNCIFNNVSRLFYIWAAYETGGFSTNNSFYNNTFNDVRYFVRHDNITDITIQNMQLKNNIFNDVPSLGDSMPSGLVFDYNDFNLSWSTGIGSNDINEAPNFINEDDFIPQNENLYVTGISGIHYDYHKTERTSPDSTIGSGLLQSENAGSQPPVTEIDYYISSSTGDDSNPGTEAEPWQTLTKLRSGSLVSGDVIGLKSGDTWVESYISTDTAGITITSYGTGAKPIMHNFTVRNIAFTPLGGNVYFALGESDPRVLHWDGEVALGVKGSGNYPELGKSVPDLVRFYYGDDGTNGTGLYVYSTDSPDNHVIEKANGSYAFDFKELDGITLDGLDIRGGNSSTILMNSSNNIIENCNIGTKSWKGFYTTDVDNTTVIDNNIIRNNTFDTQAPLKFENITLGSDAYLAIPYDGLIITSLTNSLIHDNYVKNWGHSSLSLLTDADGLDGVLEIANNKIYNNTFTSPDLAYGGRLGFSRYVHDNEFYNNEVIDTSIKSQLQGFDNHFHDNIFSGTKNPAFRGETHLGTAISIESYTTSVYGNIFENNLIMDNSGYGFQIINGTASVTLTDIIFRNNIVLNNGADVTDFQINVYDDEDNQGNFFENNSIHSDSATDTIKYRGVGMDVETFNTQTLDTVENNISGDPLLNPDYTIDDASPCVNAGTIALSTQDYFGNARPFPGTIVDIGIDETDVSDLLSIDYYVSFTDGLDTNDGLTEQTAWKTLPKVEDAITSADAGKVIAFKKGDEWNAMLNLTDVKGTLGNEITFTSYGTGAKPIINNKTVSTFTWSNVSGSIWKTTLTDAPQRLIVDGTERLGGANMEYAQLGTNVPDLVEWWHGSDELYFWSATTPNALEFEYSTAAQGRSLYLLGSDYLVFDGIDLRGGDTTSVTIYGCENLEFKNNEIGIMSNSGIQALYSASLTRHCANINIHDNNFDTKFDFDYSQLGTYASAENTGADDGVYIRSLKVGSVYNNTFRNWGHAEISISPQGTEVDGYVAHDISVYDNTFTQTIAYGRGFGMSGNAYNVDVYNNQFITCPTPIQFNGYNNNFYGNTLTGSYQTPLKAWRQPAMNLQGYGINSHDNIIEDNDYIDCTQPAFGIDGNNDECNVENNIFRNNNISNCGGANSGLSIDLLPTESAGFEAINNTFTGNNIYSPLSSITINDNGTMRTVDEWNGTTTVGNTVSGNTANSDGEAPNIVTEPFDLTSVAWNKINGSITGTTESTPTGSDDGNVFTASTGTGTCRYTTVELEAATEYTLKYFYKNIDSTSARIFIYDTTNAVALFEQAIYDYTTEYQEYTWNFTTTTATTVYLDCIRNVNASASCWNVRLTKV